ncbi:MAG: helix-turn-helix transcriptional regulator [Ottowia sp.]|nr:helix-turn-helix transcriptional regulator [Ottowia sp.]
MATRLPEAPLDITVQFGLTLRRQRDQRRWSQERLAAAANLNRTYVGELERGEAAASLNTAQKLATALGIELSALVQEAEHQHRAASERHHQLMGIAG